MIRRVGSVLRRAVSRRSTRLRDDQGATAVQLAIIAPTIMILIVGGVQAALTMYANVTVLAAAQQGADTGRLFDAAPGVAEHTASSFLARAAGGLVTNPQVTTQITDTTVTVTITADTIAVIPGPWTRISQSSSGPREIIGGTP